MELISLYSRYAKLVGGIYIMQVPKSTPATEVLELREAWVNRFGGKETLMIVFDTASVEYKMDVSGAIAVQLLSQGLHVASKSDPTHFIHMKAGSFYKTKVGADPSKSGRLFRFQTEELLAENWYITNRNEPEQEIKDDSSTARYVFDPSIVNDIRPESEAIDMVRRIMNRAVAGHIRITDEDAEAINDIGAIFQIENRFRSLHQAAYRVPDQFNPIRINMDSSETESPAIFDAFGFNGEPEENNSRDPLDHWITPDDRARMDRSEERRRQDAIAMSRDILGIDYALGRPEAVATIQSVGQDLGTGLMEMNVRFHAEEERGRTHVMVSEEQLAMQARIQEMIDIERSMEEEQEEYPNAYPTGRVSHIPIRQSIPSALPTMSNNPFEFTSNRAYPRNNLETMARDIDRYRAESRYGEDARSTDLTELGEDEDESSDQASDEPDG